MAASKRAVKREQRDSPKAVPLLLHMALFAARRALKQQLTQLVKRMDASTRLLFAQNLAATTTDDGNNLIELLFDVFEKDLIQMLDLSDQTRKAIEASK